MALALAAGFSARAAAFDPAASARRIDAIVEPAIAAKSLPGAAVAVAEDGQVVLSRAYGLSDIEGGKPVTPQTTFRLGSISKLVTALAVVRLAEQGRLRLDQPVADLLPDRPEAALLPRAVTVRRLLNHTSGLADSSEAEVMATLARGGVTTDADAAAVLARPPRHAPGEDFQYNNTGFRLLSWIVARASGRPYEAYVREALAPALGLASLRLCDPAGEDQARGYVTEDGALSPEAAYAIRGLLGEGGLCATAGDLARLPSAIQAARWISRDGLQALVAPTTLSNGAVIDYGLGVRRGMIGQWLFWGHSGSGLAGGWAALAHYPKDRVTIAVLGNGSGGPDDAITLQAKVAAAVLGDTALAAEPLPPKAAAAFAGAYSGGKTTVCYAVGPKGLTRRVAGSKSPARELLYQGDGVFAREDYPLDRLVFQLRDGRAVAHRVYYDGFFAEVLTPATAGC